MAQRENGKDSREEYRRVQARKKKQLEKNKRYAGEAGGARTSVKASSNKKKPRQSEAQIRQQKKAQRQLERKKRRGSVARGIVLLTLQLAAIMAFMLSLFYLDMLPTGYLVAIACVLVATIAVTLGTQMSGRGRRIAGKAFSVVITLVMVVGIFYILKGNTALADVTNDEYHSDTMVVAVLKSDTANEIKDAANYTFGVQYTKDTDQVQEAVQYISSETAQDITVEELTNMPEQAQALVNGQVEAIVYNEGYTEIMKQAVSDYEDKVKIIYTHTVQTDLQDLMIDVSVQEEPFSVYLSGIDVYGEIDTNSRSDVNIIATVNPKTKQILLTTTPRDYYVEIPHVSQGELDKLTHAGVYGVDVSVDTLEEIYDIDIDFYARINFTSMIDIVDILGGVDVDSDVAFTTGNEAGTVVEITEGINHLDGEQALAFCRERKAFLDGDNQRGRDQQKVITAIIQKMISPTMIVRASGILDTVASNVDTNMQLDQVKALIKQQLKDSADWHITSVSAEGEGEMNTCYSTGSQELYVTVPDPDSIETIQDLMQQVIDGEVLEDSVTASGK
ncbi:MAG: LCP family protein [Lachnospiraceae bacterium]